MSPPADSVQQIGARYLQLYQPVYQVVVAAGVQQQVLSILYTCLMSDSASSETPTCSKYHLLSERPLELSLCLCVSPSPCMRAFLGACLQTVSLSVITHLRHYAVWSAGVLRRYAVAPFGLQ